MKEIHSVITIAGCHVALCTQPRLPETGMIFDFLKNKKLE
jgi:hypothetical protein